MADGDVPDRVADACAQIVLSSHAVEVDGKEAHPLLRRIAALGRLHRDSTASLTNKTRRALFDNPVSINFIEEILEMTPIQFVRRLLAGVSAAQLSELYWTSSERHVSTVMRDIVSTYFMGHLTNEEMLEVLKLMVTLGGNPFQPPPSAMTSMSTFECVATFLGASKQLIDAFEIMVSYTVPEHAAAQEIHRASLRDALVTVVSKTAAESELNLESGLEVDTRESESHLLELIRKLIDAGADVTVRTADKRTLLHEAACCLSAKKIKRMSCLVFSRILSIACSLFHWLLSAIVLPRIGCTEGREILLRTSCV
eukprot:TRINITY_DN13917_c0_g1_i1.p1 TRINITY_DN13917_c0_g1~~TRINITY_DN13917_c0_g1_i1.p1  ORF type:complete len:324 (+),score=37.20 TRINITY_DN13917_c0_g1_i1:37-972(+)